MPAPGLIADLKQYVDPKLRHDSLEALIDKGTEPKHPIICSCKQNRLGKIFYERVKANEPKDRQIQDPKRIICDWICENFVRNEAGKEKKLSNPTILNALSNKGLAKS